MGFFDPSSLLVVAAAETGGGSSSQYWGELENKLDQFGSATNELVQLCQNYWFIPMAIALVIVAALILAGGKEGRVKAKSGVWWVFVSVVIIFSIPSIINLISDLVGKDTTDLTTL